MARARTEGRQGRNAAGVSLKPTVPVVGGGGLRGSRGPRARSHAATAACLYDFGEDANHLLASGVARLVRLGGRPRKEDGEGRQPIVQRVVDARHLLHQVCPDLGAHESG
eukprot:scaffold8680_cov107-Isochrysis_galbana.AAC.3